MVDLFKDIIKTLNDKSEYLYDAHLEDDINSVYNVFVVNNNFSMGVDTLLYANMANMYPKMTPKQNYDFYYYSLPKKKRYNKWAKGGKQDKDIELIAEYYNCSMRRAKEYKKLLSPKNIKYIEKKLYKGEIKS